MACLCHAPFSLTMGRNSFVLIALAIVSALVRSDVVAIPLHELSEETYSSNFVEEETPSDISKRWANDKNEEEDLNPFNQEAADALRLSYASILLPVDQQTKPEDRIYGLENTETSYTKDVRVFVQPEKQVDTSDERPEAELLVIPLDMSQYIPEEEIYSPEAYSREARECPIMKRLKEIREKKRQQSYGLRAAPYPYNPGYNHRFYPSQRSYISKRSATLQTDDEYDIHTIDKRSTENDKVKEETQSAVKCCQNENPLTEQTEDGVVEGQKIAKRSTVEEALQYIEEVFDNNIQTAVTKCCDMDTDIAKLYERSKASIPSSGQKSDLEYNRQVTQTFMSTLNKIYQKQRSDGHRVQKRGVNLVMGDPTYEDLGLNPKQVGKCVNEMLQVPGITEEGLDWQILGDHFRHYFTLMKDLQESYGLGLFAAIRELTNFHRWIKDGTLHGPYMSGPFEPFYYEKRKEKGQTSLKDYVPKPVYGRTGPYANSPPYVPLREQQREDEEDEGPI